MEKTIPVFTIFTLLLFTVSTATIASDPADLPASDAVSQLDKDKTAANDQLPESKNTQTFHVRHAKPSVWIQRRSFDRSTRIPLRFVRRHPCRKFKKTFVIPNKRSYGNDMMLSDKVTSVDLETIGVQVPTKWLEFKHKYGHGHHHEKFEFDGERMNSMLGHHKEEKRVHKGGFMRRVRKFLKHTFE